MADVVVSPRAQRDIRDIWLSIAVDNEPAADRLVARLFRKAELAAEHPLMGAARPELSDTARILVEGRYVMIYEPITAGLLLIAVVHGMRDPANWLA
jgi:toxin ParE1/3/4